MFNANMPSLSDIAAVTGNDRDGGWGGNGWWIIIILLAMWGGFGGYGWGANGGYGNGGGYVATAATQADIQRGFDTQNIISKLDGINYGMWDVSRRHYHDSNKSEDKEEMNRHAREHIANTLESIRTIWSSSDPELKKRMKADLTALVGELTV